MGRPVDFDSKHWKTLRARVIARDQCCFICKTTYRLTAHHIKPRRHGGRTNIKNLIALCHKCHDEIEIQDGDWTAIINAQKRNYFGYSEHVFDRKRKRLVGKDRLGVFAIEDADPRKPIVYDGVWPKVESRKPVYYVELPDDFTPQEWQ